MNEFEMVTLPQGDIQYRRRGTGRPIVFLHGLFLNGSIWDGVAAELAKSFNVIVPEFPFGSHRIPANESADLSPIGAARMLDDFLAALGLENVTLVGVDFGAVIAKIATARFGSRIERLVITNCDALEVFPARGFDYLKWLPRIPLGMFIVAQSLYRSRALRAGKSSYGAFTRNRMPDSMLKSFVEPMAGSREIRRDAGKLMCGIDKKLTLALPAELKGSGKRILVLWGNEDHLFTIALARRLAEAIGDRAKLIEVENAKTFIAYDAPTPTVEAIRAFAR